MAVTHQPHGYSKLLEVAQEICGFEKIQVFISSGLQRHCSDSLAAARKTGCENTERSLIVPLCLMNKPARDGAMYTRMRT